VASPPDRPRILIAGGYGVFGQHLARELLAATPAQVVIAGRNLRHAAAACRALRAADRAIPLALDLCDTEAVVRAVKDCFAVACAAGPFQELPRELARAAVSGGAHWLDLSDYEGWVLSLLRDTALNAAATAAGLSVMPGLSSVPALSGVLARWCRSRLPDATNGSASGEPAPPIEARVTLFVGNRNPKGAAATASALAGFTDPEWVDLPVGRRLAYRFASPDAVLLRKELGLDAHVRVALGWSAAHRLMAAASALSRRWSPAARARLARCLARLSTPFNRFGSDLGGVQVTLRSPDGSHATAALIHRQRLAILPCALVLEALLCGELRQPGVISPATWLAPEEWIVRLRARGVEFSEHVG
jgi:NAD(P)-dependent dehydrogenase (short-subunit alcohol dehydrogenase family)